MQLYSTYRGSLGGGESSGRTEKGKGGKELHLGRDYPKYDVRQLRSSTSVLEPRATRVTMAGERFASTAEGSRAFLCRAARGSRIEKGMWNLDFEKFDKVTTNCP